MDKLISLLETRLLILMTDFNLELLHSFKYITIAIFFEKMIYIQSPQIQQIGEDSLEL
ncbi:MAG: hypothetical protein N4J56_001985 [Chroococcidiopsis sp. SAG 2025]|nr:hypothetical protein [Chroococcidiopsis sp. SAG 2025]